MCAIINVQNFCEIIECYYLYRGTIYTQPLSTIYTLSRLKLKVSVISNCCSALIGNFYQENPQIVEKNRFIQQFNTNLWWLRPNQYFMYSSAAEAYQRIISKL